MMNEWTRVTAAALKDQNLAQLVSVEFVHISSPFICFRPEARPGCERRCLDSNKRFVMYLSRHQLLIVP